jgi:hypothetical protein
MIRTHIIIFTPKYYFHGREHIYINIRKIPIKPIRGTKTKEFALEIRVDH